MKPFLYALALEKDFAPATVFADIPTNYGIEEIYIPQNFNNKFNGPILMRYALASSLNVPAVYLLYRLGQKNYTSFLKQLGFDSIFKNNAAQDSGLGLALGNAPVSILELAHAFSIFPNGGFLVPLNIELNTNIVKQKSQRVISSDSVAIICSFLSDADARYLAFGRADVFSTNVPAIFKTGTANQYQSIVALGATKQYTCAVWMGNFGGETIIGKTGSSIPADIVRSTLNFLHKQERHNNDVEKFPDPQNYVKVELCAVSGMSPTQACKMRVKEYVHSTIEIINGIPQKVADTVAQCTWHYTENGVSKIRYPAEYESWFLASRHSGTIDHSSANLSIVTPRNGFVYFLNSFSDADAGSGAIEDSIPVQVIGGQTDTLIATYDSHEMLIERPFHFFIFPQRGQHKLTVKSGNETQEVFFSVE
jgi:penicillin-binding protein 1C